MKPLGLSALALTLALAASGCAAGSRATQPSAASTVQHGLVGAPAPEFELKELAGGGDQTLAAHAGKVVIVDFWATWCVPCKQSFPAYQKLYAEMNGALVVIGISQDDDVDGIAAFRSETGATFPLVWDEAKTVAKSYDPPTMPTAFVIDKSGVVRFVHAGYRAGDEQALADEVRSLTQ